MIQRIKAGYDKHNRDGLIESIVSNLTTNTGWLDNNKSILLSQMQGWTLEVVQANTQQVFEFAMSVDYPIALVVELARTVSIPPMGFSQNARDIIASYTELGLHTIVYVTRIPDTITLWQATVGMIASDSSRYFIARTVDEAMELIYSRGS